MFVQGLAKQAAKQLTQCWLCELFTGLVVRSQWAPCVASEPAAKHTLCHLLATAAISGKSHQCE